MRRSFPGSSLPRVRVSFPGSSNSSSSSTAAASKGGPRPGPWAALLLLCGVLLLTGYARIAGRIRLGELKEHNKSGGAAGMLQQSAPACSAQQAGCAPADVLGMQSMQQGIDFVAAGGSSSSSGGLSFLDTQPGLRDTADALSRHAGVHGHVVKAGVADPRAWLSNHTDERLDSFISWRVGRARQGVGGSLGRANATSYTCPAADHPPLPFPGCHVFVNHEYKYIYVRSPKSASTSIVNVLGECDNTRTRGHNASSCMALHFYWPKAQLELDSLTRMWGDYFVFGFVRNPWRRAYSLYKYIHSNGCMDNASLKDPSCRVPWSTFCADPWSAAEALHDRGCIKRSKSYLYFHMADQLHCMRTAGGAGWAVDFIGRVDEPNDDWAEVIRTLNARRAPGAPELPVGELEQQNARKGADRDPPYGSSSASQHNNNNNNAQCFDAVSRWYACDIQHYGFAGAAAAAGATTGGLPASTLQV